MQKRTTSRINSILIIVMCLVSIVLVGSSVAMLTGYSKTLHNGAEVLGLVYSKQTSDDFTKVMNTYRTRSETFAENLMGMPMESVDELSLGIGRVNKEKQFKEIMFIRYFRDGKEYSLGDREFDMTREAKSVLVGSKTGETFCAGVVEDFNQSISAVAYCVPLKNCAYADCIVLYYPTGPFFDSITPSEDSEKYSQLTTICSAEGEIVSIVYRNKNGEFEVQQHNNIYEILKVRINDKNTIDNMRNLVADGSSGSFSVKIAGEDNVVSVLGISEHGTSPFSVISVYKSTDVYSAAYSTVSTVLAELAIFFVMLIFAAVYFIISFRASERRIRNIKEYNEVIGCPTRIKFERVSADIIRQNAGSQFAVIVVDIRHFDYMTDQMGEEKMTEELRRMKDFYSRFLQVHETYGYAGNGRFILLLHYRDEQALAARLKALTTYLGISKITSSGERITLSAYGGIYKTTGDRTTTVERMVERAISAANATSYPFDFDAFRVYNERLHSRNAMNEYIEVNMQSALDNHLFKVFYQPKFNLEGSRPDGCEALVRWYNPETDEYMQPGIFLPLFEQNRFIVKLDKYVYEQVCIYIANTVAEHRQLYPISVNVSRITASEPDFVSHYIAIKNKYNIADNFLTIEFTESFAFEDYERLRETVTTLHNNGFQCSIDDFGSGFSSYNILKELPMDEIKLDRFFILKGFSEDRDLKVLSSVIKLGRELNMKVTQEGVETKDQLMLLKKLGCNVIQGYYYSKPLVQGDYDDFLTRKFIL
ncbi:MAG: GGDEF domain-containing protein [Clostridia bacterium]|nr:GGDEF domain-containing protein [Clostridia bacterium]